MSMTAMGTVIVEQLLEVFPHIEEEFILGLYDAYKEDNPDLDEMVEIVFSYDYPPLKKLTNNEDMQAYSDNLNVQVDSNIDEGRALKEDELLVSSSRTNNTDETNIRIFQQNHNETIDNCATNLKVESCDNNRLTTETITQLVIDNTLENPDTKKDRILLNKDENNQIINDYSEKCNNLSMTYVYVEDENVYENEVKLLFFELPFRNDNYLPSQKVVSQLNVNYDDYAVLEKRMLNSTNEIQSRDIHKSPEDKESLNDKLNSEVSSSSLVSKTESNFNDSFVSISKTSQADLRLDEEPCASNSSHTPFLIPNHSETTAVCNSSLTAYKFSSPDPTQSSKTDLKNGLEILHDKQTDPICYGMVPLPKTEPDVKDIRPLSSPFNTPETKLSLLRKIFPDADPEYLFCQSKHFSNSDELLLFISKNIDDKMYPKKREPEESTPEVLGFDCTIEDFLQYIPDPAAEFQSDQYVRTDYKENAEIYLKSRYQTLSTEFLLDKLTIDKYNLVKVCSKLDSEGYEASPQCGERIVLHHSPSVFFHQEIWYIENKTDIQNFLINAVEAAKLEEELNKPPPPSVEEVFECGICRDEIVEYSDLGSCDGSSGHLFCKTCIKRHVEVQMGEAKTSFSCLHNCGGVIHLQTIKEVLPPQTFDILMKKVGEEEIRKANIPGVETCPFCPYAYGPGEEDLVFVCLNSDCMKQSCRTCRKEDHEGVCDMFKNEDEEAARHFIENKMTEALVRNCHSCGKGIIKETGCNKMTCVCGALMCYICREPVQDYNHFNGQGGDNYDRCELFSTDDTLHDQPVAAIAKQAYDQLIANNPQLKLDAKKIIPK